MKVKAVKEVIFTFSAEENKAIETTQNILEALTQYEDRDYIDFEAPNGEYIDIDDIDKALYVLGIIAVCGNKKYSTDSTWKEIS